MTTAIITKPPAVAGVVTDPPYYAKGRRPGLPPYMDQIASDMHGVISPAVIGMWLAYAPDGLLVEHCGEWYETRRGQLVAIDPKAPGEIIMDKRARRVADPSKEELYQFRLSAYRAFAWWVAYHRGRINNEPQELGEE